MDKQKVQALLTQAHMIAVPGEYGLGSNPESYHQSEKLAWEKIAGLIEQLMVEVGS